MITMNSPALLSTSRSGGRETAVSSSNSFLIASILSDARPTKESEEVCGSGGPMCSPPMPLEVDVESGDSNHSASQPGVPFNCLQGAEKEAALQPPSFAHSSFPHHFQPASFNNSNFYNIQHLSGAHQLNTGVGLHESAAAAAAFPLLQRPPSSFFKYQGAKFLTRQNHDYMKAMTASWMSRFSAKDFGHLGKKIPARSLSSLSFSYRRF